MKGRGRNGTSMIPLECEQNGMKWFDHDYIVNCPNCKSHKICEIRIVPLFLKLIEDSVFCRPTSRPHPLPSPITSCHSALARSGNGVAHSSSSQLMNKLSY